MTKSKPKIAIYLPSLRGGGAERVMVTLANGFADRGYCVDLVLASAVGPYLLEVSDFVNVVDLKSSRVIKSLPRLIQYLRLKKPDTMLSAMGHANVIALLAIQFAHVSTRLVVSVRNDTRKDSQPVKSLRKQIVTRLSTWLYSRAYHIHAVSNGVADSTASKLKLPRNRIKVVYNPVVTSTLLERAHEQVDYPWLFQDQLPLIVAAGRLTKQKDFSTLLRAFAKVRQSFLCRLIILGEGELRQSLENEAKRLGINDSVLLPGFVDNPFAVMRKARIFVLSSAWEGLPNVLIQAMACGTTVVSTDCPSGPSEILENGKWGRLVPVKDVEAMAGAILEALNETENNPNVAARAGYFSVERAIDGYLDLLLN